VWVDPIQEDDLQVFDSQTLIDCNLPRLHHQLVEGCLSCLFVLLAHSKPMLLTVERGEVAPPQLSQGMERSRCRTKVRA